MSCSSLKRGGWRLAHAAARYRRDPGRVCAGARHRSLNECDPAVSTWRGWTRTGSIPVGPSGLPPTVPVEMPSHSAETRARPGTLTSTLITTSRPGRTFRRGRFLEGDEGRPFTVTVNVTLNSPAAGHDASAGQRGEEEQPPAASTPASTAATRLARMTALIPAGYEGLGGCAPGTASPS